jgi:hypothetical protein
VNEIKALHRQAMERTDLALAARQRGEEAAALRYFNEAFQFESHAAGALVNRVDAEPTRSVLLRSAASLALDCNRILDAEKLICTALIGNAPELIAEELRDLLEQVHFKRHLELRGITLQDDEIQMSISGKGVGYGIASTESFLVRVEKTETLVYRTAERKQQRPFRERGRRDKALRDNLELYMTVPRAASFAVTFKVGKGEQLSIPGLSPGEEIIDEVLECLSLFTRGDEEHLKQRIKEDAYYRNFVALARSIAPDGEIVKQVGFTTLRRGQLKEVQLLSKAEDIASQPRFLSAETSKFLPDEGPVEVSGILKFADSRKKDRDEIQIVDAGNVQHTILVPSGMMSDIVKPLWDTQVVVNGFQKGNKIVLAEISPV